MIGKINSKNSITKAVINDKMGNNPTTYKLLNYRNIAIKVDKYDPKAP